MKGNKTYKKPDFIMMEFVVNDNFATSVCSSTDTYNQVLIDCLKTGSHYIFYDSCSTNYSNVNTFKYGDNEYMYWVGGSGESTGGLNDEDTYDTLKSYLEDYVSGFSWSPSDGELHIAKITTSITSVLNHS